MAQTKHLAMKRAIKFKNGLYCTDKSEQFRRASDQPPPLLLDSR